MTTKQIAFATISAHRHQALHIVPVAMALAQQPNVEVNFLTRDDEEEAFLDRMSAWFGSPPFRFQRLTNPAWMRALERLAGLPTPPKLPLLARNIGLYRRFDAVVVPDWTTTFLKRFGLGDTKLVWVAHGAGDRSVILNRRLRRFDLAVVPGEKYRNRLKDAGLLPDERLVVAGYPKFELVRRKGQSPPPLFPESRTTVLYNPHWDQGLASWEKWGRAVLDFFAGSSDYNLIFAPHVRLHADGAITYEELTDFRHLPNIRIDLGSERSVDMTYTAAADVYLGDVSSQVCEFVSQPRPCVFLNPHGVHWRGDPSYAFWHLGPVVDDPTEIGSALREARRRHPDRYEPIQREYLEETFAQPGEGPATRAAAAICTFLGTTPGEGAG